MKKFQVTLFRMSLAVASASVATYYEIKNWLSEFSSLSPDANGVHVLVLKARHLSGSAFCTGVLYRCA